MKYFIEAETLLQWLEKKNVRVADCRFRLGHREYGRSEYEKEHIPRAAFFDIEKDLSAPKQEHGGRHPLPDILEFKSKLEAAGISNDTIVVGYDNGEGSFASRFLWMMNYIGHTDTYVLDGGFSAWKHKGYPTDAEQAVFEPGNFSISLDNSIYASYEEVKQAVEQRTDTILIDSREEKRYLGIEEPIDAKAGHIPGAINKDWIQGFQNGHFLAGTEQKQRFTELDPNKEIIVYCGSGITAAPNYIALKEAGFKKVKVYAGSFSDWISYPENPIGTLAEKKN
ncbi:sulfurtransferase [Peribacillus saganii]|uniref:Sulfurtransferase n=1 Tax=Peribacillus saganii TaxID=2303992 RepID=A0A372LDE7_9BACI|nr:sulfurtransferase [Peribacillus saganii]RFU64074.1 sulfurtransferase [Peribacillus saganii]